MAYMNPFITVNKSGIPRIQSESVKLETNDVIYDFNPHRFLNYPYVGLIIVKLSATPSTPTAAGAVYFTTAGNNKTQVYDALGEALESTNTAFTSGGIFIGWYSDNKLQLLNILG